MWCLASARRAAAVDLALAGRIVRDPHWAELIPHPLAISLRRFGQRPLLVGQFARPQLGYRADGKAEIHRARCPMRSKQKSAPDPVGRSLPGRHLLPRRVSHLVKRAVP